MDSTPKRKRTETVASETPSFTQRLLGGFFSSAKKPRYTSSTRTESSTPSKSLVLVSVDGNGTSNGGIPSGSSDEMTAIVPKASTEVVSFQIGTYKPVKRVRRMRYRPNSATLTARTSGLLTLQQKEDVRKRLDQESKIWFEQSKSNAPSSSALFRSVVETDASRSKVASLRPSNNQKSVKFLEQHVSPQQQQQQPKRKRRLIRQQTPAVARTSTTDTTTIPQPMMSDEPMAEDMIGSPASPSLSTFKKARSRRALRGSALDRDLFSPITDTTTYDQIEPLNVGAGNVEADTPNRFIRRPPPKQKENVSEFLTDEQLAAQKEEPDEKKMKLPDLWGQKKDLSKWKCYRCGGSQNPVTKHKCLSCETSPRDVLKELQQKLETLKSKDSLTPSVAWNCSFCGTTNKASECEKCEKTCQDTTIARAEKELEAAQEVMERVEKATSGTPKTSAGTPKKPPPTFNFGGSSAPNGVSFGVPSAPQGVSFGVSSAPNGVSFGVPSAAAAPAASASAPHTFGFGTPNATATTTVPQTEPPKPSTPSVAPSDVKPSFSFGAPPAGTDPKPFSFGGDASHQPMKKKRQLEDDKPAPTTVEPPTLNAGAAKPVFGVAPAASAPASTGGPKFEFGKDSAPKDSVPKATPAFSFGAKSTTTDAAAPAAPINFGGAASAPAESGKPAFRFGAANTPAAPVAAAAVAVPATATAPPAVAAAAPVTVAGGAAAVTTNSFGTAAPTFGGAPNTNNSFGNSNAAGPPAPATNMFGTTPAPFGQTAPAPFGQAVAAPAPFGQQPPASNFGNATTFGAPAPTNSFGQQPAAAAAGNAGFGNGNSFGQPAPAPGGSFGGQPAGGFGGFPSAPGFGAPPAGVPNQLGAGFNIGSAGNGSNKARRGRRTVRAKRPPGTR